ncbi:hypothetical protein, partial [Saccharothrix sp. ST-888]|uniref:hypothetical protein n=1 Tax=Saccharothrix sp. ST-888 TaxID=1427391 RepID=UPI0005ECDD13
RDIYDALPITPEETVFGQNFVGWNSSYDASPIRVEQMREWRDAQVGRTLALRPPPTQDTGAIPTPPARPKRERPNPPGRHPRPVQIPPDQTGTRHVQLARHTRRDRLKPVVQHV